MRVLKKFFCSGKGFSPVYFWSTVFNTLIAVALILRYFGIADLSDNLVLGLMGFILGLLAVYNWHKIKNGKKPK
jgi:hypothetical protein